MDKKTKYLAILAIAVIAVAVLAYMDFSAPQSSLSFNAQIGQQVPQSIVSQLNIPSSVSNRIVEGSASTGLPNAPIIYNINASPLKNGTKPEILYIGAEFCPYCAVSRWGMIIALLRFGSFSNLHYMASNSTDVYPNTPTFTFYNSTYQSDYISFVSVETATRSYQNLQKLTDSQNNIFAAYNPGGGIPFIDFANLSVEAGALVTPGVIQGYSWNETISNLTNTNSSVSQALVGAADIYTTEICRITNMTPESVCSQPYVVKMLKILG